MGAVGVVVGVSLGLHLLASALAVLIGMRLSLWLTIPLLFLFNAAAFVAFNVLKARFAPAVRKADDELVFRLCSTGLMGMQRRMMARLPRTPRCRFCNAPFGGIGPFVGIRPSGKNPNYCVSCFGVLPLGSKEMEAGVLFADLRGFTEWTERHSPSDAADLLTRFYDIANRALTPDDAFVQFIGDQVMAFYVTEMPSLGERTPAIALAGARRLVERVRAAEGALPVGVGLGIGSVEVGTFRKGDAQDFTVVGDLVNTTARLQGTAGPFEIVLSERFYRAVADEAAGAERTVLQLKGKSEPVPAYVVSG